METNLNKSPIIFGEVLFDHFPDGSSVMGGAPFNVAWNLQGLGANSLFISRVGKDKIGEKVLRSMQDWGMKVEGVQIDVSHPTGMVEVSLNNDQPQFNIVPEQAYDYIDSQQALKVISEKEDPSLIYHGSLIRRSRVSRRSLQVIQETYKPSNFVDVNLRKPWYNKEDVNLIVSDATWLKLNNDEFASILNLKSISGNDLEKEGLNFLEQYKLSMLMITFGDEGALQVVKDKTFHTNPIEVDQFVDSVGAGDAFAAVMILGLLQDWNPEVILHRANEFATGICGLRGAITTNKEFYNNYLKKWE